MKRSDAVHRLEQLMRQDGGCCLRRVVDDPSPSSFVWVDDRIVHEDCREVFDYLDMAKQPSQVIGEAKELAQ